ncbi:putative transposase-associated domain-containing protein [Tanacetum coccineum]
MGTRIDDLVKFQELLLDAEKPLYEGCPDFTKLSAIVKLLNLKGKYEASDKFFTELLGLIKKMLPAGNEMVEKTFQAKKVMRLMGSGYKKIHVCINNCLLYWKNDKDLTACRTCGTSRWKVDNKTKKVYENIPAKVMWYFPIIPRLQRLFKIESISEDLRWHAIRRITDGISVDGVDVNTGNRHHSVWPVLTVIYNLPPWLCMKRKFINLSVLISGYPGNDIDVFLEPLVDDLHTLFETGVDTRYLPYNHPFRKQKKAFNGQQEFLQAPIPMTGEQIYNEVKHIENKWGKGKRTNNNASENQEDTRGRGGKIQKQKRNTTEEEGSSSQVNGQNGVYWKKFNIWYRKLKYWRHNPVPHCIDFMHVEKNVAESIVGTLLHVPGKTKDGLNARLDLAELGVKPELFAMQDEDKTTLPPAGYTLTNAEKDIFCETLHNIKVPEGYCSNFSSLVNLKDRKLIGLKSHDYHMLMQEFLPIAIRSIMHPPTRYAIIREYHKSMETIGIPPDKHETYENEEGKPLSAGKSSEVSAELFQKAHLRHKQNLKTENPGKQIAFLENEHSKSFAKWLREEVERELAIDKESVSEIVRWISYGPHATVVKYDAYNINGYTFRTKCHDCKVYQNSGVSLEAIDLHISKEVATTRQAYYYGVLQEIWVLDYRFRQIPLFKCDWVNHKSGGVKRDKLGYTLVDLNNLGHKVDPFVLASQALQVFYVKDPVDKKLSIIFKTPPKNYKDTYDEVDEEFSTVIHHRNDNVLPLVDRRDLANESRDDYYRKDCGENIVVNLDSSSDNNNSDSYSTSQISTSEEIDYDSPEPPKSLLKWYHYLSDEYKDNGRFWGSKSGCNESDVKPSWKDIEKAKACMLAKAQAFEASSKAKVEACSLDDKRWAAKKASALVFDGPSTQGLLDAYGCDTIEEYLEWNYFPSTDNESTNMETTDKGNTDKDCIDDSNSAMSKGKYVPVCKKHNPNMYSPVPVTGCVLGLASVTTWDEIEKKMGARKSKTCADKAKGKRKVSCGS